MKSRFIRLLTIGMAHISQFSWKFNCIKTMTDNETLLFPSGCTFQTNINRYLFFAIPSLLQFSKVFSFDCLQRSLIQRQWVPKHFDSWTTQMCSNELIIFKVSVLCYSAIYILPLTPIKLPQSLTSWSWTVVHFLLNPFALCVYIWSDELSSRRSTEVIPGPRGLGANVWQSMFPCS